MVGANVPHSFWDKKGHPRDPQGGQKGNEKGTKAEKATFRKSLFYVGGSIEIEAGGDKKAPHGPPRTKSKIEEKTKTKKAGKMVTKRAHNTHRRTGGGAIIDPPGPSGKTNQKIID